MQTDQVFMASTEEHFGRRLRRGRILVAADNLNDLVGDDPELRRLALNRLHRSGRGRRKGEPRPGDLSSDDRRRREAALKDVERIRDLWQRKLGKHNRSHSPTALEIAAHRHGLVEADLIRYRANKRSSQNAF
jgi:hypothetical protein